MLRTCALSFLPSWASSCMSIPRAILFLAAIFARTWLNPEFIFRIEFDFASSSESRMSNLPYSRILRLNSSDWALTIIGFEDFFIWSFACWRF